MKPPVILVDLSNLVFRCHWAYHNLSYEGQPTGVQYGVLKIIHDLRETVSPRICFCWDHGVPVTGAAKPRNWRDDVLKAYKANRKHDDVEYKAVLSQLTKLYQLLNWLGYSSVSVMGLEADDVIGILARELEAKGEDVLVYSNDKDFYQLLNKRTRVLVPRKEKGGFQFITQEDVEKEYEIPISRFAEFLALGGDSSDNIKPMKGMGPKTAIKLLKDGVDLQKTSLSEQPDYFRGRYGSAWEAVLQSYYAARIPTSWTDPRIRSCVERAGGPPAYSPEQVVPNSETQRKFTQFLADRNMVTLLALRRKFFTTGEPSCQSVIPPLPPPPIRRRPLI